MLIVAAVPQHDALRFTRLIDAPKRATGGPVPYEDQNGDDMSRISNARVLIVATDGFEESELFGPRQILQDRGAEVVLASLKRDPIQATIHDDPGKTIRPDLTVEQARASDFDALIIPGGVRNPDQLRMHPEVVALVGDFARAGKPIAAICHGPWLLVEADLLRGRTATSWPSIRTDLRNAGANVVDLPAVTDGNIVTSRKPDDVEPFTNALIALVEKSADRAESRETSEMRA
jgi:protease I